MWRTPLYDRHVELGAKMAPFADWEMPIQYSEGILAEHKHTRTQVSLFDICHMGELQYVGALEILDKIVARPIMDLKIGRCRYNYLLNDDGGILDDLVIYRMDEKDCLLVVNAATASSDAEHIAKALEGTSASITDWSGNFGKLDLQGPLSADVLEALGIATAELPGYYCWKKMSVANIPCIVSRTGYTGELGFELYCSADNVRDLWDVLLTIESVNPAGLGARDLLRLEMGYPLYGHEMAEDITPLDIGARDMLQMDALPHRDFIGRKALENTSPRWKPVAILCASRKSPRNGFVILHNSEPVGLVSSGAIAPSIERAVALGRVEFSTKLSVGDTVELDGGRGGISGKIVELPFYSEGTVRKKL